MDHKSSTPKPDISSGPSIGANSALQLPRFTRNGIGIENQLVSSHRKQLVQDMRSINAMNLD
eukprot:10524227-Karenia_brevis.AAC.1